MTRDRRPQVRAQKNYLQHRVRLETMHSLDERFAYIYEKNLWGSLESRSGLGSRLQETEVLRRGILSIVEGLGISSILDIPCGDFRWMDHIALPANVSYTGADIVQELVARNRQLFGSSARKFVKLDITADPLPEADLILCRDCLVHLSYVNIQRALVNIKRSRAKWLLMTHFLELGANSDISDGDWRPLNFLQSPFLLPKPQATVIENCQEGDGAFADKALALWRLSDLQFA